jgi:hypothetical protein
MKEKASYFEFLPNGILMIVPAERSIREVLEERAKIAQWVCGGNEAEAKILVGTCSVTKASMSFKKKKMIYEEPAEIPLSVKLQDMIDVYNTLTAEQVISAYKKSSISAR